MAILIGWDLNSRKLAGALEGLTGAPRKAQHQEPETRLFSSALTLKSPLTLGKSSNFSQPQFLYPQIEGTLAQPNCRPHNWSCCKGIMR